MLSNRFDVDYDSRLAAYQRNYRYSKRLNFYESAALKLKALPRKIALIIQQVGVVFDVHPGLILGRSRMQRIADARQHSMFLARELTRYSYHQLGRFFDRDHTTVLYAVTKINAAKAQKSISLPAPRR